MSTTRSGGEPQSKFKRCPECFAKLPLHVKRCHACNLRVGEADKFGLAKRPVNWIGYSTAIILWIVFGFFVWWAFLKS